MPTCLLCNVQVPNSLHPYHFGRSHLLQGVGPQCGARGFRWLYWSDDGPGQHARELLQTGCGNVTHVFGACMCKCNPSCRHAPPPCEVRQDTLLTPPSSLLLAVQYCYLPIHTVIQAPRRVDPRGKTWNRCAGCCMLARPQSCRRLSCTNLSHNSVLTLHGRYTHPLLSIVGCVRA